MYRFATSAISAKWLTGKQQPIKQALQGRCKNRCRDALAGDVGNDDIKTVRSRNHIIKSPPTSLQATLRAWTRA